jgi:hypothetical protein
MDASKIRTSKVCDCRCGCRTIVSPSGGECGGCLTGLHGTATGGGWVGRARRNELPTKVYAI